MGTDPTTHATQFDRSTEVVDDISSTETRLLTPNGLSFRPRTYYLPEVKRTLDDYYRQWKQDLPEPEYQALSLWYGRGFKAINEHLRNGVGEVPKVLQASVDALTHAINLAPSIPTVITELFRGESHELLSIEEAKRRCEGGTVTKLSNSFLATSIYENEAFNFARDYHASGFTEGGLMIPIGALQKPVEQQIIYQYILPEDRTELKAAWIGQTIGEMLFQPNTHGQWLQAEEVAYIPADDMEELLLGRRSNVDLATNAEYRLLVTIQLMPSY